MNPKITSYIAASNPGGVDRLIYEEGYEPPETYAERVHAIGELLEIDGTFSEKLLQLHPDRDMLQPPEEDCFCGSCATMSYNPEQKSCTFCGQRGYSPDNPGAFTLQLSEKGDKELRVHYENLLERSNMDPENRSLAAQVQLAWNELRKRTLKEKPKEEKPKRTQAMLILGFVGLAGLVIGRMSHG